MNADVEKVVKQTTKKLLEIEKNDKRYHCDFYRDSVSVLYAYLRYKLSEEYAQQVTKMIYLYNSGDMSDIILVLPADLSATWWGELSSYAQCWCLTYDNSYRENVAVFLLTRRKDYARRFIDNFTKIGEVYICSHKQVNELICAS